MYSIRPFRRASDFPSKRSERVFLLSSACSMCMHYVCVWVGVGLEMLSLLLFPALLTSLTKRIRYISRVDSTSFPFSPTNVMEMVKN